MLRKILMVSFYLLLSISAACSSEPSVSPTPDTTEQAESTSVAATQRESDARATADKATEQAEQIAATDQAALQTHLTEEAAAREVTRTAVVAATLTEATAQAQPMADLIQELYEEGYLSRTSGTYYALPDFDESWAQINWYQWHYTDYSPTDFVIRVDASWSSASDTANWFISGCGFVFREDGVDNHYLAYLGLDGWTYFMRNYKGVWKKIGSSYYRKVDVPEGKAQIMLVVEGELMTFFVNGKEIRIQYDTALKSGELGLTLLSGTNKGYGTRCQMTNIELWILK